MQCELPITVIIPTFNAELFLGKVLKQVCCCVRTVIIVDGGSSDSTRHIASRHSVTLLRSGRGRGYQMRIGGEHAKTDWLFFLHADTILERGWQVEVSEFLTSDNLDTCGVFSFGLDDFSSEARRVERFTNWRSSVLGLPYGDQGLLISRAFYNELGGFRPLPVMEDVEIIRRIGKSRLKILNTRAVTSAIRYRTDGWWRRPFLNLICLVLYFLGVPPHHIAKIY
ncbi:MAG: TIGR04283 family arsenosugar biosynthesis glycosyltransferase [Pseudomonadota bacterium]|nr:TIGR04283 family arsenosugar biosynthesis glycosyltransferase [Pseudomonadota bacterium]